LVIDSIAASLFLMITIRLSMNGESPITEPVTGLRRGAPGMAVSSVIERSTASVAHSA
jgi:hypothetical protein